MVSEITARQIGSLLGDGASVADVAEEFGLEPSVVRLIGERMNVAKGQSGDRDITDADLVSLRKKALDLALSAESQEVQARMTMFLLERDKPSKKDQGQGNMIAQINQIILQGNEKYDNLVKGYTNGTDDQR